MNPEILRHSVLSYDIKATQNGGVMQIIIPPAADDWGGLPMTLPLGWQQRDKTLLQTPRFESVWAGALHKVLTSIAAPGFQIEDAEGSARRIERVRRMFVEFGGLGYVASMMMICREWFLTNNGVFIEKIMASPARGSRVLGIAPLPSQRCERTGDPRWPVRYWDLNGNPHKLRDYQVIYFADNPDTDHVRARRSLACAAERAYDTIAAMSDLQRYFRAKVRGDRPMAVHFTNMFSTEQLETAIEKAKEKERTQQVISYMGAVIIGTIGKDTPGVATVPLQEIPQGFDPERMREEAYIVYANNLGVPVQMLRPLSGQGLGTGKQTEVLQDAADEQGIAALFRQLEHVFSYHVLPASTMFTFANRSHSRQRTEAELQKLRAEGRKVRIEAGELAPEEARQLAADAGDLPPAMLEDDVSGTPEAEDDTLLDAGDGADNGEQYAAEDDATVVQKSVEDAPDTVKRELKAAEKLYEEVTA